MSVVDVVNRYYEAWNAEVGDFGDVPLAEDLHFSGPMHTLEGADSFRSHAARSRASLVSCSVREQFVKGDRVCSIVDWELGPPVSRLTTTEIIEVRDGRIVSGELIFDPERFRDGEH